MTKSRRATGRIWRRWWVSEDLALPRSLIDPCFSVEICFMNCFSFFTLLSFCGFMKNKKLQFCSSVYFSHIGLKTVLCRIELLEFVHSSHWSKVGNLRIQRYFTCRKLFNVMEKWLRLAVVLLAVLISGSSSQKQLVINSNLLLDGFYGLAGALFF